MESLLGVVGLLLGILVFAGFLSFHALYLVPAPCTGTYPYGTCPASTPQEVAYSNAVHALAWAGVTILDLAVGLSVALAFIVGTRTDVPESTRRSIFLFATVYLGVWTVLAILLVPSLLSFVRYA